ncbi:MAG: HAMP domain-containing histidine kinase, partial [Planctomycetaceae bacterium]|nr:HAMP domain-containing histidine kinase [Planctomycetaceae bacterium]
LVLVMLVMLSLSGISGLMSYRNAVNDLDFSINRAPRRADLSDAIGLLFDPLWFDSAPETIEGARYQQQAFQERLAAAQSRVSEFRRKLDNLPPSETIIRQRPLTLAMLDEIDRRLDKLGKLQSGLTNLKQRDEVSLQMQKEVGLLASCAQRMPDYQDGLNNTLTKARVVYRSRFVMVCLASTVVVLLFLGLVRYGYLWIFAPLRKLHQGASRVALGDYSYRLQLNSNDEMAELAESFNKMTERFQDTTSDLDRKIRERSKQLVRSERLAGIGFLAAGVAHEINNPLQAIGMAGESLQNRMYELLDQAPEDDRQVVHSYLSMIQSEADRCQQITRKLLDFARGQDNITRTRFDLSQIVREVLSMIQHMSKFQNRKIEFTQDRPCYVEVNGPEIKQVVLNLVANALESMDEEGTLTISLREQMDQVVLEFVDTGCGMTTDTIDNLFEPFYTRRRDGKGTGLGMSISQRIIGDHGGTIEAKSDGPGCGSTFYVHLPRRVAEELPVAA